jgi:hypothetical protein
MAEVQKPILFLQWYGPNITIVRRRLLLMKCSLEIDAQQPNLVEMINRI